MRISDWSSDVCSSDLLLLAIARVHLPDLDDLAHRLHVEAVALGFGKHVLNVFAQPLLLFLQSLDPLDIRAKLLARLAADSRGSRLFRLVVGQAARVVVVVHYAYSFCSDVRFRILDTGMPPAQADQ